MKTSRYLLICAAILGACSCNDDDKNLKMPDISVNFATTATGFEETATEVNAELTLSRPAAAPLQVTLGMTSDDIFDTDISTLPALTDKQLVVAIPAGKTTASFSIAKKEGKKPEGAAKFSILSLSASEGFTVGDKKDMQLTFGAFVSTGDRMTLEGKTSESNYANMVYADLSANTQTPIHRKSWDLGFHCGDKHTVTLNSSYATVAVASEKSVFSEVTIADANQAPNIAAGSMTEDFSATWIDAVNGDLSKTVFGTISENDAENKVFFVASEDNKKEDRNQWYKVKISRKGEAYSVQYGKVGDSTPRTVEVTKNPAYNLIGLSLETGNTVNAQPEGKKWDILWCYGAAVSNMNGNLITSFGQDVVVTNNIGGVETALIMTDGQTTYDNFTKANASQTALSASADIISNNWRVAPMPGVTSGVKTDRFYLLKDSFGNYYKIRFTKLGTATDGAVRGRPEIEYALLK